MSVMMLPATDFPVCGSWYGEHMDDIRWAPGLRGYFPIWDNVMDAWSTWSEQPRSAAHAAVEREFDKLCDGLIGPLPRAASCCEAAEMFSEVRRELQGLLRRVDTHFGNSPDGHIRDHLRIALDLLNSAERAHLDAHYSNRCKRHQ
jgi:hypothetical protein